MVDVTKANFSSELEAFRNAVLDDSCQFVAIDTEFTGLATSHFSIHRYMDTPQQRYAKSRQGGENFLITQFGVSTVHKSLDPQSVDIKTWNFYLFPRPYGQVDKRFLCQSSSIDFLSQHGFDFNKFVSGGISFMTRENEEKMTNRLEREASALRRQQTKDEDMVIVSDIDRGFLNDVAESVKTWYGRNTRDEQVLELEGRTKFHRRLIHDTVRGYPGLYSETDSSQPTVVKIVRASEDQRKEFIEKRIQRMQAELDAAVGFSKVIQVLSQSKLPIVGHNCLLDFIYAFAHFHAALPPTLTEFKRELHELFPRIYDTKYLIKKTPALMENCKETNLESLYVMFRNSFTKSLANFVDKDSRYQSLVDAAHEAGYDALMTAVVFLGIQASAQKGFKFDEKLIPVPQHFPEYIRSMENQLNVFFSDIDCININLEHQSVDRSNVYHVFGRSGRVQESSLHTLFEVGGGELGRVVNSLRGAFVILKVEDATNTSGLNSDGLTQIRAYSKAKRLGVRVRSWAEYEEDELLARVPESESVGTQTSKGLDTPNDKASWCSIM